MVDLYSASKCLHSDFSTTANVYAHLDYNSKLSSADAMVNGLKGALSAIN